LKVKGPKTYLTQKKKAERSRALQMKGFDTITKVTTGVKKADMINISFSYFYYDVNKSIYTRNCNRRIKQKGNKNSELSKTSVTNKQKSIYIYIYKRGEKVKTKIFSFCSFLSYFLVIHNMF